MTLKQGFVRARSYILMLVGLCVAFGIIIQLELWDIEKDIRNASTIKTSHSIAVAPSKTLSVDEVRWAQIAWKYFENNYQESTGLVNSANNYPSMTLWDTASYLLGLISAHRLEIISQYTFDTRLSKILSSLARLPLFEGKLPNKVYNTKTLEMVNYGNQPEVEGVGWSAIDIGRILVPLNIILWNYPQHAAATQKVLKRWDFNALIEDAEMRGAVRENGHTQYVQEGRMGYEQYAAKALQLVGLDVSNAMNYRNHLNLLPVYGIRIPTDNRTPEKYNAHNYVVSESYILDGIEYGWDQYSHEFAARVYKAQEARYKETKILTAVSEDNIDQAPHFVYNTVFTDGQFWNAITETGQIVPQFKTLSTKAAFGWYALYDTKYTQKLIEKVKTFNDPEIGWYSGMYEATQELNKIATANTNAIILESLCYKQEGKLMKLLPAHNNDS